MARYLKTNTATVITVGPFLDLTDAVTPEVALTVTNDHATLMVDNAGTPTLALDADLTASGGDNDCVHITNDDAGFYSLELTAAQLNYLGGAILAIIDTDVHLPVFHEFTILPAQVYDSLIAGSDLLAVDTREISSDSTAADNAELMFDGTGYAGGTTKLDVNVATIAANAITAAAIATGAVDADAIADNAIDAGAIATGAITNAKFAAGAIDAAAIANAAIDNATFAADVGSTAYATNIIALAADKAVVNAALATAANLADLHTDVGTAITAIGDVHATDLPAVKADTAEILTRIPDATAGAAGGLFIAGANAATTVDITGTISTVTNLTNNTPTIDDTAANHIADHVWDEVVNAGHAVANSAAVDLVAVLADTNELQADWANGGRLDLLLDGASAPSAATVADAVWDEVLHTDHEVAGSASVLLQAAGGGADAATIADAVWDEVLHTDHEVASSASVLLQAAGGAADPLLNAVPGAYGAGTAGYVLGTNLAAVYGATEKAAIDLLDDADGGLADIHTVVNDLHTDVGDVHTDVGTALTNIADLHTDVGTAQTMLTDIHDTDLPAVKSDTAAILVDTGTTLDGRIPAALVGGRMDASVGAMANNTITAAAISTGAIDADAIADNAIDAGAIAADAIAGAKVAADAVTKIQTGLATPTNITAGTITTVTNLTNLPATGATAAELAKVPKSDSNVTWNATALASINAEVVDVMRTDTIPDSYSAHEAQPTIAQALLEIRQILTDFGIVGTTLTVNKPDGTTAAYTLTLDDNTNPTSAHRGT